MNAALATYEAALRRAASGAPAPIYLAQPGDEPAARLEADHWCDPRPGDVAIGGDPVRLLRRCARLLRSDGDVLVEAGLPGSGTGTGRFTCAMPARSAAPSSGAAVAAENLGLVAVLAGLRVAQTWSEAGRWFGRLGR
jgi:hypothetical protein